jgi:hypothetical protein
MALIAGTKVGSRENRPGGNEDSSEPCRQANTRLVQFTGCRVTTYTGPAGPSRCR